MEWKIKQQQLLYKLVDEVKDTQMTFIEYKFISDLVYSYNGANFLVFGTGRDSNLWVESNINGKTIFLEPDLNWINIAKTNNSKMDIRHVIYKTHPSQAEKLYSEYQKTGIFPNLPILDKDIIETEWDIIFIDSPVGSVNGRMTSIFISNELAKKTNKKTHIFLHDSHRPIETMYSELILKPDSYVVEEYNSVTNNFDKLNYFIK